jgi:hypothetical protein
MARTPELQRFYASKRWRDLRQVLIIQRHGICSRCGKDFSDDTSQLIAHHLEHLTDDTLKDPAVAVNPENVEIVCQKCHAHYHPEKGFTKRKQVFIVYGSPLSGKSTYVRQNMESGDLVVDLDTLRSAISYQPIYSPLPTLSKTAFALRDFLYDQIRIRSGDWYTAWVIAGLPRKDERERLAARLGASLILVEATKEECQGRLLSADDGRFPEWEKYIDQWYRDYIP